MRVGGEMGRSGGGWIVLGVVVVEWVVMGLLAPGVAGRFVVEKNSLLVTSPSELRGKHDSAIGNFGIPQYGGSMAGAVVYPRENTDGCDEFRTSFRAKPGALPNIVLVDRGGEDGLFLLPSRLVLSPSFWRYCEHKQSV